MLIQDEFMVVHNEAAHTSGADNGFAVAAENTL
jgi:hypothetical protein